MSDSPTPDSLFARARSAADHLADQLELRQRQRIVFAESCTAGLVVALLARRPGISQWLVGSAVTYRESAKQEWLGVSPDTLEAHSAESAEATLEMAQQVLRKSSEATLSLAVTGHLGPQAPAATDGHLWIASLARGRSRPLHQRHLVLQSTTREDRQWEAAACVLELAAESITGTGGP